MSTISIALETNTAPRFSAKVLAFSKSGLENHIAYLVRYTKSISPKVSLYPVLQAELEQCRARLRTIKQ